MEEYKKGLEELKIGEVLNLDITGDEANSMRLLTIKLQSYNNLFMSYMNNTNAEATKFTLDAFLERCVAVNVEIDDFKTSLLKKTLGEDGYNYVLQNPFMYNVNYEIGKLQLWRKNIIQSTDNSQKED